jgi:hypothetical protein
MEGNLAVLAWLFVAMFAAFAAVALFKLLPELTGRAGFLVSEAGGPAEPERAQAMAITMATFSLLGFWGGQEIAANSSTLPDIPASLLVAFGASQVTYVGGKFLRKMDFFKSS